MPRKPEDLVALIRSQAEARPEAPAQVHLADGEDDREALAREELDRQARAMAVLLARRGQPGDRVLVLMPPGIGWLPALAACAYAGRIAVPVPAPERRNRATARLAGVLADCTPTQAIAPADAGALAREALGEPGQALGWIHPEEAPDGLEELWTSPGIRPDDPAFLQYTSGSTGTPRGVVVRHRDLLANLDQMAAQLVAGAGPDGVSWLPPFHDMGLVVGLLLPLHLGGTAWTMAPDRFLARPRRWLAALSRSRAGFSAAPDSAYALCVERIGPPERAGLDLSAWQVALSGAEPVRAATLARFAAAFGTAGFARRAFTPAYGLAECVVYAAGGGTTDRGPTVVGFDPPGLEAGRVDPVDPGQGRELVGCGSPAPGTRVRVVDPASEAELPGDRIGELQLAGPQATTGYWGRPTGGGWVRTGDLGFVHRGEVFVAGRLKDLILIRGRSLHPQDVEAEAEAAHPALRPGAAAAFGVEVDDREELVVAVCRAPDSGGVPAPELLGAVRRRLAAELEVSPRDVLLVRPAELPRTTSGKLVRSELARRYRDGSLRVEARAGGPGSTAPAEAGGPDPVVRVAALVAAIFAEVLRVPAVGIDEDFFEQGGDSIRATHAIAELRDRLGVPLAIEALFEAPTARRLAEAVLALAAAAGDPAGRRPQAPAGRRAPGVAGHPLLGNLEAWSRDPLALIESATRELGDVVRLEFGGIPVHLAAHPDHVVQVLEGNARNYVRETGIWRRFRRILGMGLLTSDGPGWGRHRRTMGPFFAASALEAASATVRELTRELAAARARDGAPFDLMHALAGVMCEASARTFWDESLGERRDAFVAAALVAPRLISGQVVADAALPDDPLGAPPPELVAALATLESIGDSLVARLRALPRPGSLAAALEARPDPGIPLRDEVLTLVFAAGGAPPATLTWLFWELARSPGLAARLRAELDAPDPKAYRAAIHEVLRLRVPVPIAGRLARRADTLGGFPIPARSYVLALPLLAQRHREFWKDGARFDPDRWLRPGEVPAHPGAFAPFGLGAHRCIGEGFGLTAMREIFRELVRAHDVVPEPGSAVVPELALTLRPSPLRVRLVPRPTA